MPRRTYLLQNTCTLHFSAMQNSQFKTGGWYAVALTIEDFPTSTVTIGGKTYSPYQPISAVPLQVSRVKRVVGLFLAVLWGCQRFVIVVYPDHTH